MIGLLLVRYESIRACLLIVTAVTDVLVLVSCCFLSVLAFSAYMLFSVLLRRSILRHSASATQLSNLTGSTVQARRFSGLLRRPCFGSKYGNSDEDKRLSSVLSSPAIKHLIFLLLTCHTHVQYTANSFPSTSTRSLFTLVGIHIETISQNHEESTWRSSTSHITLHLSAPCLPSEEYLT